MHAVCVCQEWSQNWPQILKNSHYCHPDCFLLKAWNISAHSSQFNCHHRTLHVLLVSLFCCSSGVNLYTTAKLLPDLSDLTHLTHMLLARGRIGLEKWNTEVHVHSVTNLCARLCFCYFRVQYFNAQIKHRSFHHFITFNYSHNHCNMESCYQMLLTN